MGDRSRWLESRGRWSAALAVLLLSNLYPGAAFAFGLFPEQPLVPAETALEEAARWTLATGLGDGLQVGVEIDFANDLLLPGESVAEIEQALLAGFEAWEDDVIQFDVEFEAAGTVEGPDLGFEIDVFAVPGSHPMFVGTGFFGRAVPRFEYVSSRTLTNGQVLPGFVITGVDLYFNIDMLALLGPLGAVRLDVLTRLAIHEMGHGIGLGHPNDNNTFGVQAHYDTDTNPFNVPSIDPLDPFSAFMISLVPDNEAIMSNAPCGPNPTSFCPAAAYTTLQPDDVTGRDALYVPESSMGLALRTICAALLVTARSRRTRFVARRFVRSRNQILSHAFEGC